MRKMVITLLALGVFAASAAFAGNLLNEPFTYTDGGLVGKNPGAPATGPWANYSGAVDIKVVSNTAVGGSPAASYGDGDDHLPFTPQSTSTSTYACFDAKIGCFTGQAKAIYFAGLKDGGASLLMARVYVLPITGGWTFGISNTSTSSTTAFGATPWGSAPLSCDTWYHIVIKYDPTTGTSTLWVNPVNESSPSVSNTNASQAAVAISTFFLRQSASASSFPAPGYPGTVDWHWTVDNVGAGTSFDAACYAPPPPTTGACCLTVTPGACVVVTPDACATQNGIFQGLGTVCEGLDCLIVPANKTSWGQLKTIYR